VAAAPPPAMGRLQRAARDMRPGRASASESSPTPGDDGARRLDVRESAPDIGMLLERLGEAEAALVVGDLDLDTTTPVGRATASALTVLGNGERDRSTPAAGVRPPTVRADEPERRQR
jgi:hypothetical protein